MNIKIPKTIEAATAELGGIAGLLTAKQWERAAIVYAFTDPQPGSRTSRASSGGRYTYKEFAGLKITGLSADRTISEYRKAWHDAILDGQAVPVEPGDVVELPNREFPSTMTGATHSRAENVVAAIKRNPEVIKEIVEDDPEAFEAVAEAVSQHAGLTQRASEKVTARVTPKPKEPKPKYWDQMTDEVIGDFAAAMVRLHALVEHRDQLDEFALRKVIKSLSANSANLDKYLTDLQDTYRLAFGELPSSVKVLA